MPTLEAFIAEQYSDSQKQQLIAAMTAAVVESVSAPVDSVRIILSEVAPHNYGVGGQTLAAAATVNRATAIAAATPDPEV